ncbi:hypothetical protein X011_00455 [Mycobacterium tuberculosis variant microti OV254]|nr:hypothetical protein X011_00455 [Mycobacterium tuberculosis variant microti OV254]BBX41926.1 hypothetical protein MSIM_33770 [Mycobacterium simiae]
MGSGLDHRTRTGTLPPRQEPHLPVEGGEPYWDGDAVYPACDENPYHVSDVDVDEPPF